MAVFDWMANLAIDAAGGDRAVFGSRPDVATFTPTDLGAESKKAAQVNTQNLPEIQSLLERILPGWKDMVGQGSKNAQSMLRGEIPEDVAAQLRRNSAYQSFRGGYGGSGMSKALTARDFGLTSLDLMGKGENSAQKWMSASQQSVAPWLVTGQSQAAQTEKNNLYKQAVDQFRMNVAASADPAAAGLFNTIAAIGGTAASFGTMGMGGGTRAMAPTAATTGGGGPATGNLGYTAGAYAGWGVG